MTSTPVVTCSLMGGLGNQLMQICTVIAHSMRCHATWYIPVLDHSPSMTPRRTYWNDFLRHLLVYNGSPSDINSDNAVRVWAEPHFAFAELPMVGEGQVLEIKGHFHSWRYFHPYIAIIAQMGQWYQQRQDIMDRFPQQEETVSIHFRIGDYVGINHVLPVCPVAYFRKAIRRLLQSQPKVKRALYFYQEEDQEIVSGMVLALAGEQLTFTPAPSQLHDWESLLLMSGCDHHIIANSSFSWWAAYINPSPCKSVFYPSPWFGPCGPQDVQDVCPGEWEKVDYRR